MTHCIGGGGSESDHCVLSYPLPCTWMFPLLTPVLSHLLLMPHNSSRLHSLLRRSWAGQTGHGDASTGSIWDPCVFELMCLIFYKSLFLQSNFSDLFIKFFFLQLHFIDSLAVHLMFISLLMSTLYWNFYSRGNLIAETIIQKGVTSHGGANLNLFQVKSIC